MCVSSLPVFFLFCLSRVLAHVSFRFRRVRDMVWFNDKRHFPKGTSTYSFNLLQLCILWVLIFSQGILRLLLLVLVRFLNHAFILYTHLQFLCHTRAYKVTIRVEINWTSVSLLGLLLLPLPLCVCSFLYECLQGLRTWLQLLLAFHSLSLVQTIRSPKGFSLLLFSASSIPVKRFLCERLCSSTKLLRDLLYTNWIRRGGEEIEM